MQTPAEAQVEVMTALRDHFDRSGDLVYVQQICEMTGLGEPAVTAALRVLDRAGRIVGVDVAEFDYPIAVSGVRYE